VLRGFNGDNVNVSTRNSGELFTASSRSISLSTSSSVVQIRSVRLSARDPYNWRVNLIVQTLHCSADTLIVVQVPYKITVIGKRDLLERDAFHCGDRGATIERFQIVVVAVGEEEISGSTGLSDLGALPIEVHSTIGTPINSATF